MVWGPACMVMVRWRRAVRTKFLMLRAWHSIAWSIAITVIFAPLAVRRYRHIG